MPTHALRATLLATLVALASPGCLEAPEHFYGYDLLEHRLSLYRLDMGVHPSTSVLDDPNNPFRFDGVGDEMKWTLESYANNAVGFYSWATLLAQQPNGEHQFYTATKAHFIYVNDEVSHVEKPYVRDIALAGYAALLEHFPESVSYDASGTYAFRLAPLAYHGILELGGTPPPGWVIVETPSGPTVIPVPDDSQDAPDPEEEDE